MDRRIRGTSRDLSEDATTPVYIHPGTVIGVSKRGWPAIVEIDAVGVARSELTPVTRRDPRREEPSTPRNAARAASDRADATPVVDVPSRSDATPVKAAPKRADATAASPASKRADATPVVLVPSIPPRRDSSLRPPPVAFDIGRADRASQELEALRAALVPPPIDVGPAPPSRLASLARSPALWGAAATLVLAIEAVTSPPSPPPRAAATRVHGPERHLVAARDAHVVSSIEAIDPMTLPRAQSRRAAPPEPTLLAAQRALATGRYDDARRAYDAVLAHDGLEVEGLAGLGDVARLTGDPSRALELYERALALAPQYVPARIGRADVRWAAGDRARSTAEYRAIVESFDDVPTYVKERAAGRGGAK